jgi:hypothetical protein
MRKENKIINCLLLALLFLGLAACAGTNRGKLNRVQSPTEGELRQNWKDYIIYYRGTALVYKNKDDKEIILGSRWEQVTTDEMMQKSKILDQTWVREILGQNDVMFGYLVHRAADIANVKIVDETTIELFYQYVRTSR